MLSSNESWFSVRNLMGAGQIFLEPRPAFLCAGAYKAWHSLPSGCCQDGKAVRMKRMACVREINDF